ncbi:hypothetical protein [uncultured Variovorax sp.]|uniref:hypothetical protein n=1 Tax=uncultured Variovorax sp. TaxID=114708 RepID=UPI0025F86529|nr:hypothetical protein [uncultured Variovorax sp.]
MHVRLQSLQRVAAISRTRFRNGLEDCFAGADAQRELYIEQRQWIELQLKQAVNTASLYKALGGSWEDAPVPNAPVAAAATSPRQ